MDHTGLGHIGNAYLVTFNLISNFKVFISNFIGHGQNIFPYYMMDVFVQRAVRLTLA